MYGVFTYIWVVLGVNVGKYTIHWASGIDTVDGSEIRHQLRVVGSSSHNFTRVLYIPGEVAWDFFHQQYYPSLRNTFWGSVFEPQKETNLLRSRCASCAATSWPCFFLLFFLGWNATHVYKVYTLPETNSSHLKMDGFLPGMGFLVGAMMLVSGSARSQYELSLPTNQYNGMSLVGVDHSSNPAGCL